MGVTGNINEYQKAVGVLFTGRHTGWTPLFLIRHTSTLAKYEKILGIKYRVVLMDMEPRAEQSVAEYQKAVGVLFTGRHTGWKPLFLIHHTSTLAKYEKILGIKYRVVLMDMEPRAEQSVAWKAVQKFSNFWKAVNGESSQLHGRVARPRKVKLKSVSIQKWLLYYCLS